MEDTFKFAAENPEFDSFEEKKTDSIPWSLLELRPNGEWES